jgi:hypothetical protein
MLRFLILACWISACDGGEDAVQPPAAQPSNDASLSPEVVKAASANPSGLIPSPLEIENAVRSTGVAPSLVGRVPADRGYRILAETHLDRVAIQTGVLLTDVILTARTASSADLSKRLGQVHLGLKAMGADENLLRTVKEFENGIAGEVITREALLEEMARITDLMVPEKKWGPSPQTGPLVQAGAWLAGVHMVAVTILESDRVDTADQLLKHPEVVGYFIGYVSMKSDAPSTIMHVLHERLEDLQVRTAKETLSREDVESIVSTTDGLFRQL